MSIETKHPLLFVLSAVFGAAALEFALGLAVVKFTNKIWDALEATDAWTSLKNAGTISVSDFDDDDMDD